MVSKLKKVVAKIARAFETDEFEFLAETDVSRRTASVDDLFSQEIVFFITPGRSGTQTLIEEMKLNTSLFAVHAPTPWLASIGSKRFKGEISESAAVWSYYACRERYIKLAYEHRKVFVDGDCKNLPLLPDLADAFPNSKFIHIVRDPRSFILSGIVRGYFLDKSPEFWGHLSNATGQDLNPDLGDRVNRIAQFWDAANDMARLVQERVSEDRFTFIKSEEMFYDGGVIYQALSRLRLGHQVIKAKTGPLQVRNKNKNQADNPISEELLLKAIQDYCPTAKDFYPEIFSDLSGDF